MSFSHYPRKKDWHALTGEKWHALTIYQSFNVSSYKSSWVTELKSTVKGLLNKTEWSKSLKDHLMEILSEEIDGKSLNHPYLAVFLNEEKVTVLNTISRLPNLVKVDNFHNIIPLLRTTSNPRKGWTVAVSSAGWDVYRFDGMDSPTVLKINKGRAVDYDTFTSEAREKHLIQKIGQDLDNEHLRRYVAAISDLIKKIVNSAINEPVILIGDSSIVNELSKSLDRVNTFTIDDNVKSVDVEKVSHKIWDEVYIENSNKNLENLYGLLDDGLSVIDLSELGISAFNGNVDKIYISSTYDEPGTYSLEDGSISFNGRGNLLSKISEKIMATGGKVYVLNPDEVNNPNWNNTFIALKRWSD